MHIVSMIFLGLGAFVLLGVGLVSVIHDLLSRGPYAAPVVDDDLAWPARHRGPEPVGDTARADLPPHANA